MLYETLNFASSCSHCVIEFTSFVTRIGRAKPFRNNFTLTQFAAQFRNPGTWLSNFIFRSIGGLQVLARVFIIIIRFTNSLEQYRRHEKDTSRYKRRLAYRKIIERVENFNSLVHIMNLQLIRITDISVSFREIKTFERRKEILFEGFSIVWNACR